MNRFSKRNYKDYYKDYISDDYAINQYLEAIK